LNNNYTLTVLKGKKEFCHTTFSYLDSWDERKEIPTANYGTLLFNPIHHIELRGIKNIDCGIANNITDIIIGKGNKFLKLLNCKVEEIYNDGFELIYDSLEGNKDE
jgi:hypothetical protein